jgi:hypothetical protein
MYDRSQSAADDDPSRSAKFVAMCFSIASRNAPGSSPRKCNPTPVVEIVTAAPPADVDSLQVDPLALMT